MQTIVNLENQEDVQSYETHITEDIGIHGHLVSSSESEKISDVDADESNDTSIMGKIFNTRHDAYTSYNRYAFLHGFGINIHWNYKNKTTKEVYHKMYVSNEQGFKHLKAESACGN
ncbi:unnamed protein product [Lactuca saligna]|uniref:Protein FAR1-RELATED SEQUENCE n=1 Tax=Lactuca saligna TaxID=75948 RepID=A0AA35Z4A0_LACSI|nr:unnamed protein product [Lactuca saligna]